ncbi:MAG: hypothetical protein Q4B58_08515 [Bacteroidales bacterium]|nr:hypothetical protein [Bacteroidales bacterium]
MVEDIVDDVIAHRLKQDVNIAEKLDSIIDMLKVQHESLGISDDEDPKEVFSTWRRSDVVFLSDERLYNRKMFPNCPFKSRSALQRVKAKFPDLFFKNEQGYYVAIAGDLLDFICNQQARDIARGKGIRYNKKRK